jgi:thiol-disulfide isomerase/thioredoxin
MKSFDATIVLNIGLFIVGIACFIFWFRMRKTTEGFASESYKMVMYGVDWCPHCVEAKPKFQELGTTQTIGGKTVEFAVVNPEKDKAAAEGKNISGYPTFHLYNPDGSLMEEYEGPRTKEGILDFLTSKL